MSKWFMGAVAVLVVTMTTDGFAQSGKSAATSRKPAVAATPTTPGSTKSANSSGTGSPWVRSGQSKADWLLEKRLESIEHMRQIALKTGNTRMLEQADKLEALARRQYDRRNDHSNPPDPATP